MFVKTVVQKNTYYDSIQLMRIAGDLSRRPGVVDIAVLMGTAQNKAGMGNGALRTDAVEAATANDLFIVVQAEREEAADEALALAQEMIVGAGSATPGRHIPEAYSWDSAIAQQKESNIALFSLPGAYVRTEAEKALDAGLHLMIFSDNVPVKDERALKIKGREKGLLVMGPDCGTSIINGAALAFANAVRRGRIGLIGASGTGIQEVSCLIHDLGEGVSHAIGVGSRDVRDEVGGIMTMEGMRLLAEDGATDVIAVVSKMPDAGVLTSMRKVASCIEKPVVFTLLGGEGISPGSDRDVHCAFTLEDAAVKAVALLRQRDGRIGDNAPADMISALKAQATQARAKLGGNQKYLRGLFCGGTFTGESASILASLNCGNVYSNVFAPGVQPMRDVLVSCGHCCIDMGDDVFTQGKPHPMIEPYLRHRRILREAEDPETAVLLLDAITGYGCHSDPAGVLAESLAEADEIAKKSGRYLPRVVYLCGVEGDPQNYAEQKRKLSEAGCIIAPTSKAAALLAAEFVKPPFRRGGI
ncbi:MAG: acyl-CoA synthetase FdrA [Clostridiales Family XIII bacterium]|jgi:succinyl-CoA synthetase alpha subunit|nr:acyl-CoA synthetase FdrA [Clostridiales Family XIII bacterium]